jgi:DNA-binding response OmpR family regulator
VGQRWKALVVGGTDAQLAVAKTALEQGGFDVAVRPDAIGTCAHIVRERPDVLLLDPAAPVLSARDVIALIRADLSSSSVLVLLWSDDSSVDLSTLAREIGADGWVRRGGDARVFATDVRQWADRAASVRPARGREGSGVRRAREVLFVHGQEPTWQTFQEQLGGFFSCRWSSAGREAFRILLSSEAPAVVVSEIVLPDLGGDVLYRTSIRREESWSQRFVFVTHLSQEHPLIGGLRAWPAPIHFEPWSPAVLRVALRAARAALAEESSL